MHGRTALPAYADSYGTGTLSVLQDCRHTGVEPLVFASAGSVNGANTRLPFSVRRGADHPLSLDAGLLGHGQVICKLAILKRLRSG